MGYMFNGLMDEWLREVVPTYADRVDADPRFPEGKVLISAIRHLRCGCSGAPATTSRR